MVVADSKERMEWSFKHKKNERRREKWWTARSSLFKTLIEVSWYQMTRERESFSTRRRWWWWSPLFLLYSIILIIIFHQTLRRPLLFIGFWVVSLTTEPILLSLKPYIRCYSLLLVVKEAFSHMNDLSLSTSSLNSSCENSHPRKWRRGNSRETSRSLPQETVLFHQRLESKDTRTVLWSLVNSSWEVCWSIASFFVIEFFSLEFSLLRYPLSAAREEGSSSRETFPANGSLRWKVSRMKSISFFSTASSIESFSSFLLFKTLQRCLENTVVRKMME